MPQFKKRFKSVWRGAAVSAVIAQGSIFAVIPENAIAEDSNAGVTVNSVTPVGDNRYNITGIALDKNGNPACALALASGKCMFTCGPGSLLCEGGTADLPFGEFALEDLAVQPDGSIHLQIHMGNHVSHNEMIVP